MTELENAARMALEALQKAVPKDAKQAREQLDAIAALTQALATTEPVKPLFATKVAAQKWAELQEQGHRMQTIWFDGGPGGAGTIDPWGKVTWSKTEPATTERKKEPTKAELIAQARDLIEAQEHAHNVGFRMGLMAASERKGEPVAWMWQHEETGRKGFVEADQLAMGWEVANPRLKIVAPLYTSPQVPEDVMSVLSAIHRRPSDAGVWLDDLTRIIRAARKGE